MLRTIDLRTPISYGWGLFEELERHIPDGRCFLVLGGSSKRSEGWESKVRDSVRGELTVFRGVEPNPTSATVEKGAEALRRFGPDYVLAVGGGSVMDAAKFMGVIGTHGGTAMDYVTKLKVPPDAGRPLYAVPTTPGTSSEITPFAIVTVPERRNKLGLRHPSIYPKAALVDPALTVPLPKDQTASTGLDILSHAVESFWSAGANPLTQQMSLTSVRLVRKHLEGAFKDGSSREHREGMSLAGLFAGMSFSNTGTTICHAISYPITVDTGLPHGMACALSLGPTFDLLRERKVDGLSDLSEAFGSTLSTFREDLSSFMKAIEAPTTLSQVGFKGGVKRILATDMENFKVNFTKRMDDADVERIVGSME